MERRRTSLLGAGVSNDPSALETCTYQLLTEYALARRCKSNAVFRFSHSVWKLALRGLAGCGSFELQVEISQVVLGAIDL